MWKVKDDPLKRINTHLQFFVLLQIGSVDAVQHFGTNSLQRCDGGLDTFVFAQQFPSSAKRGGYYVCTAQGSGKRQCKGQVSVSHDKNLVPGRIGLHLSGIGGGLETSTEHEVKVVATNDDHACPWCQTRQWTFSSFLSVVGGHCSSVRRSGFGGWPSLGSSSISLGGKKQLSK